MVILIIILLSLITVGSVVFIVRQFMSTSKNSDLFETEEEFISKECPIEELKEETDKVYVTDETLSETKPNYTQQESNELLEQEFESYLVGLSKRRYQNHWKGEQQNILDNLHTKGTISPPKIFYGDIPFYPIHLKEKKSIHVVSVILGGKSRVSENPLKELADKFIKLVGSGCVIATLPNKELLTQSLWRIELNDKVYLCIFFVSRFRGIQTIKSKIEQND